MKYRNKPVIVEAFQMTFERFKDDAKWPEWLRVARNKNKGDVGSLSPKNLPVEWGTPPLQIREENGLTTINWGSHILRHADGTLSRCSQPDFDATYEPVIE